MEKNYSQVYLEFKIWLTFGTSKLQNFSNLSDVSENLLVKKELQVY